MALLVETIFLIPARVVDEGDDARPVMLPGLHDGRIGLAPFLRKPPVLLAVLDGGAAVPRLALVMTIR